MNATRFLSLTEFCKHLGRTGVCHVDETEKGWFVSWIDNSPRALARSEAESKKQRGDVDDETRQRKLIQEQIERAREEGDKRRRENAARLAAEQAGESSTTGNAEASGSGSGSGSAGEDDAAPSQELKRDEGAEKVSLNLSFKMPSTAAASTATTSLPTTAPTPSSTGFIAPIKTTTSLSFNTTPSSSSSTTTGTFTPKPNPFKPNPLKAKSNPLKSGSSSSSGSSVAGVKRAAPVSAMEAIVQEELARKNRMMGGGGGGGEQKRPRY